MTMGVDRRGVDRRKFIKTATAGAAALAGGAKGLSASESGTEPITEPEKRGEAPWVRTRQVVDVAVVGAGAFGSWTALDLQKSGAQVTLIDQYGPANSRSTSGGETRGVRTGYGNKSGDLGLLWTRWASRAIERWKEWDEQYSDQLLPKLFFQTSDLIMREEWEPFLEDTQKNWDEVGVSYEVLDPDEIRYRWPVIDLTDITVALHEHDAGVVRARRAIESVARVFTSEGGTIQIAKALPGDANGRTMDSLALSTDDKVVAGTHVFALGPWYPKMFPELWGKRLRTSIGHVVYFRVPPGDNSYSWPNLPSYNFPGVTGWPALTPDSRGFRVRAGGAGPGDPDTSVRWLTEDEKERQRRILRERFPGLADAPVNETRACHYEFPVGGNFIIDHHPDFDNVWFVGGGAAEGFKFGPVVGEYASGRILGTETDPELIDTFAFPEEEFEERGERGYWEDYE